MTYFAEDIVIPKERDFDIQATLDRYFPIESLDPCEDEFGGIYFRNIQIDKFSEALAKVYEKAYIKGFQKGIYTANPNWGEE